MATGTLLYDPRPQLSDANGSPLNGGLLYSYDAGTTTLRPLYQDVTLLTPHSNPVVLDAAGRAPAGLYASASPVKLVLKTSTGVTSWTQDNYSPVGLAAISSTVNNICDGRLTLTSVTPVTTADVTAATTVYWSPFRGNRVALYDGSAWAVYSFSELSLPLGSDAANTNYDVFAYNNGGTVAIERLAWSAVTVRATGLVLQDGVLVKSGTTTRRYLGTYRTTGTVGQTEDSAAKRFVWNYYNRLPRALRVLEVTNSWTYTTSIWRQANASAANQVAVVIGWAEVEVSTEVRGFSSNSSATPINTSVAIAQDATNAPTTDCVGRLGHTIASGAAAVNLTATLRTYPSVGYHFFAWIEYSEAAGTTSWLGDNGGVLIQAGLSGVIEG
ncbi:MAG TPA: hypothetical protein VNJ04_12085 [Gemmatimonadaceae bacterium]|nr:hypothetical protein [Gemmatimonadaceae bacterium]